jgi:ribonuclease P protein component
VRKSTDSGCACAPAPAAASLPPAVTRVASSCPRSTDPFTTAVLARTHRVVRAEDYRGTVRRGRRITSPHLVAFVRTRGDDAPVRFGFIVSKAVGNAVTRNRVRRRLKAVCFELLSELAPGSDIVVRALPAAAQADWTTLQHDVRDAVERGLAATVQRHAKEGKAR